jgi:hypothetical protein
MLGLQYKKITADNIVCRTTASDGEIARDVEILLTEDKDDTVLATTKTDATSAYPFQAPASIFGG